MGIARYTPGQFKAALKSGSPDSCIVYGKSLSGVEVSKNGELTFTISSSAIDRDNDKIEVGGWEMENFRKNPVVLWAHDGSLPPIGRAPKIWSEGQLLKSMVEFTPADMPHPLGMGFGATISRMFQEGFLNATSVGFRPKEFQFNADRGPMAVDFAKQELLEFSAVPIPANPEALVGRSMDDTMRGDLLKWCDLTIAESQSNWAIDCAKQLYKGLSSGKAYSLPKIESKPESAAQASDPKDAEAKDPTPIQPDPEDVFTAGVNLVHGCAKKISDETKRGRVLSANNEGTLRDALALIQSVLVQLDTAPIEDSYDVDLAELQSVIDSKIDETIKRHHFGDASFLEGKQNG